MDTSRMWAAGSTGYLMMRPWTSRPSSPAWTPSCSAGGPLSSSSKVGPPWDPGMRVYAFSRTLRPEDYPDVTVIGANEAEVVAVLRRERGEGDIWLFGGGQLFSSLLAGGQVDAVEVTVVPVLLGGCVPLAAHGISRTRLRLLHTHQYPTGMISLNYAVER